MNPLAAIDRALLGWADIVTGKPGWRDGFDRTRGGVIMALAFYLVAAAVSLILQSIMLGWPSPLSLAIGLLINCLPLLALLLVGALSFVILRPQAEFADPMVPAIFATAGFIVLGPVFSWPGYGLEIVPLVLLGYLMFRAGRVTMGLPIASALAFAVFDVVALVALPLSLYMLAGGPPV
jgi:hypothetical protein